MVVWIRRALTLVHEADALIALQNPDVEKTVMEENCAEYVSQICYRYEGRIETQHRARVKSPQNK